MNLGQVSAVCSPLTGEIFIARFGKDPNLALDKRNAEKDVCIAVIQHMMHDAPKGSERDFMLDNKYYRMRVEPITKDEYGKY